MSTIRRSMAFPPGTTVVRATPKNGGELVAFMVAHLPLPRGATAAKTRGRSHHVLSLPVRRHDAPCEGRHARRSLASLYRTQRAESVPTRFQ